MTRTRLIALLALLLAGLAVWWMARPNERTGTSPVSLAAHGAVDEPTSPPSIDPLDEAEHAAASPSGPSPSRVDACAVADTNFGTLVVRLTGDGKPIPEGAVRLLDLGGPILREQDVEPSSGTATLDKLPIGDYGITIVRPPTGWLTPTFFSARGAPGILGTTIESGVHSIEIELQRSIRVFGTLCGEPKSPPHDLNVLFLHLNEPTESYSGRFLFRVVEGRYEGEVYPGTWLAEVRNERNEEDGNAASLLPITRSLGFGSDVRIDFECEDGSGAILGRIVDEEGKPFVGLRIDCERVFRFELPDSSSTVEAPQQIQGKNTEADGKFSFTGLASGHYRLRVERDRFHAVRDSGENKIGAPVEIKNVQLTESGPAWIEISARRSHLVHVSGSVAVDAEWARRKGCTDSQPSVSLLLDPPNEIEWEERIDLNANVGRFDLRVEAAAPKPRIRIELCQETAEVPIDLSSGSDLSKLELRFPK